MEELIKSFRLGVVQVFGIILPGLALLPSFAYLVLGDQRSKEFIINFDWKLYRIEIAAIVLILGYILGFVVRLIPLEWLDRPSRAWLNFRNSIRHQGEPLNGPYPYANIASWLEQRGLNSLGEHATWGRNPGRAHINSLKLLVASKNQILANALASSEASIRMMFGVFVAGLTALAVVIGSRLSGRWPENSTTLFTFLVVCTVCLLFFIFHTFTQTRCTELIKLLMALKICNSKPEKVIQEVTDSLKSAGQTVLNDADKSAHH